MCTESLAKIVLIIINVVFFIGGGAILAVGIIAFVDEDLLYNITSLLVDNVAKVFDDLDVLANFDLNALIQNNAIIIIVVGAVLFGIGFCGCCGAMRKSSCLLQVYAIILLVILAAEVGLGVYAYMYSDQVEEKIQSGLSIAMDRTYKKGVRFGSSGGLTLSSDAEEIAWDAIQFETSCCGVTANTDWVTALSWNNTYVDADGVVYTAKVPISCCARTEEGQAKSDLSTLTQADFVDINDCITTGTGNTVYEVGCYDRLREIIFDNKNIVLGVFVIIILIEILGISCACYLKKQADGK